MKDKEGPNLLLERDPVKISFENGDIKLLAEVENSIISSFKKQTIIFQMSFVLILHMTFLKKKV